VLPGEGEILHHRRAPAPTCEEILKKYQTEIELTTLD